jgi:hypothetical protein
MANDGKYLEQAVEKFFKELNLISVAYLRLPDSRSARNMISAQPADFLVSSDLTGKVKFFLECKSKKQRKPGVYQMDTKFRQYPHMLRWHKAGMGGYVLVHWMPDDKLQMVDIQLLHSGFTKFSPKHNFEQLNSLLMEHL